MDSYLALTNNHLNDVNFVYLGKLSQKFRQKVLDWDTWWQVLIEEQCSTFVVY